MLSLSKQFRKYRGLLFFGTAVAIASTTATLAIQNAGVPFAFAASTYKLPPAS
jgi:hypothetical protein